MKNIPIAVAFIASIGCTYILLSSTKKEDIKEFQSNAYGIEIGVFKTIDNAEYMRSRLGGYIIKDDDVYRIYYGIFKSDNNIAFITNYLKNEGISYYVSEMLLAEDVLNVLERYEKNINEETATDKKIKTIFEFMKKYEEVL